MLRREGGVERSLMSTSKERKIAESYAGVTASSHEVSAFGHVFYIRLHCPLLSSLSPALLPPNPPSWALSRGLSPFMPPFLSSSRSPGLPLAALPLPRSSSPSSHTLSITHSLNHSTIKPHFLDCFFLQTDHHRSMDMVQESYLSTLLKACQMGLRSSSSPCILKVLLLILLLLLLPTPQAPPLPLLQAI